MIPVRFLVPTHYTPKKAQYSTMHNLYYISIFFLPSDHSLNNESTDYIFFFQQHILFKTFNHAILKIIIPTYFSPTFRELGKPLQASLQGMLKATNPQTRREFVLTYQACFPSYIISYNILLNLQNITVVYHTP